MKFNSLTGVRCLSNMWDSPFTLEMNTSDHGKQLIAWRSAEAAYQACKVANPPLAHYLRFTRMNPFEAKKAGKTLYLREDWDEVKTKVMWHILKAKFTQNSTMKIMLLNTDEELIHDCPWGDRYWGVTNGVGENVLGLQLMKLRDILRG
jgi:ribA/ribD-fused uncharacterized protein